MKKIVILFLVLLLLPAITLATDDVNFSTDTNLTVGSYTIVIKSGSICDQLVVNTTNIQITLSDNSQVTLTSSDKVEFNLSDSSLSSTACGISQSSINFPGQTIATTVTVTPSGTCSSATNVGSTTGSTGGGIVTSTPTPTESEVTTGEATITSSDGGTATVTNSDDTTASVNLPANAVAQSTAIKIIPTAKSTAVASRPVPSGKSLVGSYAYEFTATASGSSVASFSKVATLTFSYTDEQIKGLDESALKVFYWDEDNSQWTALPSTVNTQTNTITAETDHFTYFGIFGSEAEEEETVTIPSGPTIIDGDLIQNPNAEGMAQFDIYIAKIVANKKFKRLILSPHVFESYGHLSWDSVKAVSQSTMDSYTTSNLVRCMDPDFGVDDPNVYKLTPNGDTGTKGHMNMTAAEFEAAGYDWDSIYIINKTDRDAYTTGSDVTSSTSSTEQIQILATMLNVRSTPSLDGEALTSVYQGETYDLLDESDGWYKIKANGETGWCYGGDTGGYATKQ